MVRRTRKRSKNKKGGADTSFTGKFLQGANDIGKGLQDASEKAKKTYKIGQHQLRVFNNAAEAQKARLAQGGDGEKISLFENPQALLKPRRPVFPKPVTPTIIGRGGKRKTRRKKRRKNKKRKTKKRRRKRKTKKKRRR